MTAPRVPVTLIRAEWWWAVEPGGPPVSAALSARPHAHSLRGGAAGRRPARIRSPRHVKLPSVQRDSTPPLILSNRMRVHPLLSATRRLPPPARRAMAAPIGRAAFSTSPPSSKAGGQPGAGQAQPAPGQPQ